MLREGVLRVMLRVMLRWADWIGRNILPVECRDACRAIVCGAIVEESCELMRYESYRL